MKKIILKHIREFVLDISSFFMNNIIIYPIVTVFVVLILVKIIAIKKPMNPWLWSIPIWIIFFFVSTLFLIVVFTSISDHLELEGVGFILWAISHLLSIVFGGLYIYYLRRKNRQ